MSRPSDKGNKATMAIHGIRKAWIRDLLAASEVRGDGLLVPDMFWRPLKREAMNEFSDLTDGARRARSAEADSVLATQTTTSPAVRVKSIVKGRDGD